MRAHTKKQWYSEMKFVEQNDDIGMAIIEEAIKLKSVGVPDGINN